MAYLPDTQNEEIQAEESLKETPGPAAGAARESNGRFWLGFLLGVLLMLLCAAVFIGGWFFAQWEMSGRQERTGEKEVDASVLTNPDTLYKLNEVQALIEQHYLDEVDSSLLSACLFKGIAAGLEDPYANYYSAKELESVMDSSRGEYVGIGATLAMDTESGEISVAEVYENGPAAGAGLQTGDILLSVDGETIEGLNLDEVVDLIKGHDDAFPLGIFRPETEEELELTLECGEVEINYVTYELLDDGIGYLRLSEFTERAVSQFENAVSELTEQGMEKLIVDLRGNPGGLLDSVCDILDEILPEGLIVYTENRQGERREYESDSSRTITCSMAVLVDEGSASASEIFAGAIQDYGIGPIVGTTTYGKGVVQETYSLSDGSAFKLTTETYYTPKGQEIDGNGITPDVVVEDEINEDEEAGDGTDGASGEEADSVSLESDAVLAAAIESLKSWGEG